MKTTRPGSRNRSAALWVAATTLLAAPVSGAVYYVGSSVADCDATTISAALALAAATSADDEIRLTRTLSYINVNLFISDWDAATSGILALTGGWDDCLDASASGRTPLSSSSGLVAIEVEESGASTFGIDLELRALEITGANTAVTASGRGSGPGGPEPDGTSPVNVYLVDTQLRNNEHGAAVTAGAYLTIGVGSEVRQNVPVTPGGYFGAGLICTGDGSRLDIAAPVRLNVVTNAPGTGGGVYADDGCQLTLSPGAILEQNEALQGGGIYMAGGATAQGGGNGTSDARITDNVAVEGGGVMAIEAGTSADFLNLRIEDNSAGDGGGLQVGDSASFLLRRSTSPTRGCFGAPRCVTLSGNQIITGGDGVGAAVNVFSGGFFRMVGGFVEENFGLDDDGFAIHAEGDGTRLELEGVQIFANRSRTILYALGGAEVQAAFVSAADNVYWNTGILDYSQSFGAGAVDGSTISIYTSIFTGHQQFVQSGVGTEINVDCMILDTTTGTTSAGANMIGVDPLFENAAGGNLRLRPGSPAIDACDTLLFAPTAPDYDLETRGYDTPTKTNNLGPFDRGADEVPLLFAGNFDSGTFAGWIVSNN